MAGLGRAEEILNDYPGLGFDQEALFRKGEALAGLGQIKEARAVLESLLKKYPQGDYHKQARRLLEDLQSKGSEKGVGAS